MALFDQDQVSLLPILQMVNKSHSCSPWTFPWAGFSADPYLVQHAIKVQKYISTGGFTSPSLRCNWPIWQKLEFQASLFRCNLPPHVFPHRSGSLFCAFEAHLQNFVLLVPWAMSPGHSVGLSARVCICVCRCVELCSVSAQHIPWGPQWLWTAKCHTKTFISLKNGLRECNSSCTFGPCLDLLWLCKAEILLKSLIFLLNFVICYFKVIFQALGYLFFNI